MGSFTSEDIELAKKVQEKYGVPASVTLAQYALESGYGTSNLAKNNKNYFGMRAGSNGWQKFNSKEESFMAYGKLMSSDLYTSKTNGSKTINEYVESFSETYAPSSDGNTNYSGKVLKIISQNNLTQYDTGDYGSVTGVSSSTSSGSSSNGLTWWGDIVKVVFILLLVLGGIIFIGMGITSSKPIQNVTKDIKKVVK